MNLINGKSSHTIILANKTCMFCTVSKACFIYDSVIAFSFLLLFLKKKKVEIGFNYTSN